MSTEIYQPTTPAAVAVPERVGQATAVEQSRAVAEVQGAILVAQRCPRDQASAVREMREVCKLTYLAERAFFRFPRAGSMVTGPSIHLARELARIWGNFQHGISEMRRDDQHGQSEMKAYAWDVQTNTRVETGFIVPHTRDKTGGPVKLTDGRDIYENNANAGARRVRECILDALPVWFVEEAKELCKQTLEHGGGKPLQQRIADAIEKFEDIGITVQKLERKTGQSSAKWTGHDLAQLTTTYRSLQRGEVSKEDEFPPARSVAAEIVNEPVTVEQPAAAGSPSAEGSPAPAEPVDDPDQLPLHEDPRTPEQIAEDEAQA